MKKFLTIFLSLILCLFIFGCDSSAIYTVQVDEQAIVTQNGKIVGDPKEPGLHFKIPVLQQVHLIKVHRILEFDLPVINSSDVKAKIFWSVKDAKKFFMAMQKGVTKKSIKPTVEPAFNEIIDEYSPEKVNLIYKSQEEKTEYAKKELCKISAHIQGAIDDFGVKIVDVYFEYNKSVAQQLNPPENQGGAGLVD